MVASLLEENGIRPAEFLLGDMTTFKVVVANADVIENGTNGTEKRSNVIVNIEGVGTNDGTNGISKEDRVVELMRKNKRISVSEISKKLNIPRRTLFRIIESFKASNLIRRVESLKSGTWEVLNE